MGILKSIKFRDKLYMTLKMSEPDTQEYANVLTNLRTYNRILKCCIRTAKKLHYEQLFHKYKQDIKQTWCTIYSILNKINQEKHRTYPILFMAIMTQT